LWRQDVLERSDVALREPLLIPLHRERLVADQALNLQVVNDLLEKKW
jgi:hypothetical protein